MRYLLSAVLCLMTSTAGAFTPGDIEKVEGVLSRLALERGAFVACASDAELKGFLEKTWTKELKDVADLLAQNGFPERFVASVSPRFDLAAVARPFASADDRDRYCAVLGDWKRRWELFYVQLPTAEIEKVLRQ